MLCLKCATPNAETSRFCSTCGEPLGPSGETATESGVTRGFSPTGPSSTTLVPGSILGGRYRIVEAIGMGGMGMVYRAVDLELSVPVALKVIRGEFADNEKILERFKKEITIARRVTHRNVARIYDFGEADGVKYISMEYIEGRDLARIIEQEGPLSAERLVGILKQCCEALAEAHSQGVVHRDLKPHNVMIDVEGNVRLMDFGIALSQETRGLTRTGAIIGTPEYMSPEQAEGKKVDRRADVYSLGVTMYEALTGAVPFSGSTQWEVIRKHIQERAKPLRRYRAEIPAWLETLVLKCLEKNPEHRYQSIDEILRDIERQKATRLLAAHAPRKRTWVLAGGALALVAAAVGVTVYLVQPRGLVAGPGGRFSLAVLPFENQTGRADLDWLRTGLAENLGTDLGQSKYFRVLTRERLGQILKDLGRSESGSLDSETLARIAEYGGVQAILTGSFVGEGETLRINLRAQDPRTGEGIGSVVVPGRESDVLAMIDELTVRTKVILRVSQEEIAADVDTAIASARTSSLEAASLFQKGVDFIHQGQNLEAVAPLEEAVSKDPGFVLAWARLSQAYRNLGYDQKAQDAADAALARAEDASDRLMASDRAFVRAAHAAAYNNGQEAIEAYDEMVKADPYDATAAYNLGRAYERTGQWDRAEVFFRKALELDRNYAVAQASIGRVKILSGRPEESLPAFQTALDLYRRIGSQEGEASVYHAICEANISLRRWDEAITYCSKSEAIKDAIGDKRGLAVSLAAKAYVQQVTGRLDEALASARKALDLQREIGDTRGVAAGLGTIGSILQDKGETGEVLGSLQEALQIWREVGDEAYEAEVLQNLGGLHLQLGDLSRAERNLDAAADIYSRLGIQEGIAQVTSDRGMLALARAEIGRAEEAFGRASEQWKTLEINEGLSETEQRQAAAAIRRGRYGTAIGLAEQALADYEEAEDRLNTARCRGVLAEALLRAGDVDGAVGQVESGLSTARDLGNTVVEADLEAVRAEIHLLSGSRGEAAPLIASVCAAAEKTGLPRLDLSCAVLRSRAALAEGKASEAITLASAAASGASAEGRALDALDASVERLQAMAASGERGAADAGAALLKQARRSGAGEIILRSAPAAVAALARAGRAGEIPDLAGAFEEALRAARQDLPQDRLRAFLERGLDAAACREMVAQIGTAGGSAEAGRIEALLEP